MSDEQIESSMPQEDLPSPMQQLAMAEAEGNAEATGDAETPVPAVEAVTPEPTADPVAEAAVSDDVAEPASDAAGERYLIEGKEYDSSALQAALVAQANQQSFDAGLQSQLSEMKTVHDAIRERELAIQAREQGIQAQAGENEKLRRYLISQGAEVGDPVSEHLQGEIGRTPAATSGAPGQMSQKDIMEMIRGEIRGSQQTNRAETLKASFIPWIQGALAKQGIQESDPIHDAAYKSLAFDLAAQFEGNPDVMLKMPDNTLKEWIGQKASDFSGSLKQRDAKFLSDAVSEAATSGRRMPVTPTVAGTPLPDHAAPIDRRNQADFAKELDKAGGLDRWFDQTETRMHDTVRHQDKLKRELR